MITQFNDELSAVAAKLRQSTVKIKSGTTSVGSGVIWQADGLIITNAHVATSLQLTVELSDGREFPAVRSHFDPQQDLAALKINATNLNTATLCDRDQLRVGELVLAVGNPLANSGAVTIGIVHTHHPQAVIADLQLYPGNSGGPLADCLGRVVGINTMIVNNLAVAIPIATVNRFLSNSQRLQLGVTLQPVVLGRRSFGLLVLSILPGSVAENVGLQIGDVLVGVSGRSLTRPDDLAKYLHQTHLSIPLQILRNGQQFVVYITRKNVVEVR
ncbi:trypsin-like peptidase domain-containing protein [Nostoc sp. FACHB-152]|uniref:S1C family serine protease n=1 Tax=unclassified Nostoc TaxID=2593658 RepID=UPI001689BB2E|nr:MULTISPECIES: trypsin-like peptidase domain-containing protein [unclassified Nostoc]MBD2450974.1 trypsin-like peptidase domain-containing protein [Nostoc sp. FACHB-152]MBD2470019.1 trypsin-like peptidase domain-containing protein [Nostoc sp. FACHB-145]